MASHRNMTPHLSLHLRQEAYVFLLVNWFVYPKEETKTPSIVILPHGCGKDIGDLRIKSVQYDGAFPYLYSRTVATYIPTLVIETSSKV
jgi:hypothetical protein